MKLVIWLDFCTWKNVSVPYKKWTNKNRTNKTKRQEQRLKAIRKNHIDKKKEKKGILCKAGIFYTKQGIIKSFMHAIAVCIRVPFSKMVKNVLIIKMHLCIFVLFSIYCPFSALFYPFWKN